MEAELIAVGSELLHAARRDGNSEWLSDQLGRLGLEVRQRSVVEDDPARIAAAVSGALERAEAVLLTGGLGPTEDDRTREGLALALGVPLERDSQMVRRLQARFEGAGYAFGQEQARQADRPRGMGWLDNPLGAAPGLHLERGGRQLFALPGVPAEMKAMFHGSVRGRLPSGGSRAPARRSLRIAGRTESGVDRAVRDLYDSPGVQVTILSGARGIELLLRAHGPTESEARARLDALDREISERLAADVYGRGDESLPAVVGKLLRERGSTLATAESCTAGLLGAAITEVSGSSEWYRGGLVVYSDALKVSLAGVGKETLEAHGAVSGVVAQELAEGARRRCHADIGIGITGVAGPGGGTAAKPVGLVYLGLSDDAGGEHWRLMLPGDREQVRQRSVTAALDRLRRWLLGVR